MLAAVNEPGTNGDAAKALDAIINNPDESTRLRCRAAHAMGDLTFASDSKLDFKPLADHIGHLAVDVCKQQLEHAEQPTIDEPTRDPSENLGHPIGRRRARGLLAAATEPSQKPFVESVAKRLKTLDDALDKPDLAAAKIEVPLKDLESVLQPRGVAPKGNPMGDEKAEVVAGRP